ncbi:DUF5330 domain-containing protein [Candidatus Liberibacter asiaticus]
MFWIAKKFFWISVLLIVLSNVYAQPFLEETEKGKKTEITDFMTATSGTVGYASNLCNAKPEICLLWKNIMRNVKRHTLNGAKIVYGFAKSALEKNERESVAIHSKNEYPPPLPSHH